MFGALASKRDQDVVDVDIAFDGSTVKAKKEEGR
jgi:hypothetical protein